MCRCVLFNICAWTDFVDLPWERVEKKKNEMCMHLLMTEFDRPEMTLCCVQDIQMQLLTSN